MRLDFEEYDLTVQYLMEKDNHIADALSRITIQALQSIQTDNKILKVTTRNQSRQKSCAGKEQKELLKQSTQKVSRPNFYNVINNGEVRKVV